MKNYKEIYQFPLVNDMAGWIRDSNFQFVAQFEFTNSLLELNIINIINGDEEPIAKHTFKHFEGMISEGEINYILIRGWGNLTGVGGHNLSPEEAANVQDTFADYIVQRLNSFGIDYERPLIKKLLK